MFENYLAKAADIDAIEKGISYVWHRKLDFIFKDKQLIRNVVVISYDSKYIYVWKYKSNPVTLPNATKVISSLASYDLFKIRHSININNSNQLGWRHGFILEHKIRLDKILISPSKGSKYITIISGTLLFPYLASQKKKVGRTKKPNPYQTLESYLATIVHEFGHAYFHNHLTWWYSNKKENLTYLNTALNLYKTKEATHIEKINIPNYDERSTLLSELFAFCTDYSASSIFWKSHRQDIDISNVIEVRRMIREERNKNLSQENSVLDPDPSAHNAALILGKVLIELFPKDWPGKLFSANYLQL